MIDDDELSESGSFEYVKKVFIKLKLNVFQYFKLDCTCLKEEDS